MALSILPIKPRLLIFAVVACCCVLPLQAEYPSWEVISSGSSSERVSLTPAGEGFATLRAALDSLAEPRRLSAIRIDRTPAYRAVQSELYPYLEQHHRETLEAALASSGNLHNPKMRALGGPFREAVLATSYVESVNELLAGYGLEVVGLSFEKLLLDRRQQPPSFFAVIWLNIEPCPEGSCTGSEP